MGFAILHVKKNKTNITKLEQHINRDVDVPNADATKKNYTFYYYMENGSLEMKLVDLKSIKKKPLQEKINERIKIDYKGKTKIRKDAVKSFSIVLTGTHEDMNKIDGNKWVKKNYEFLKKKFGIKNIVDFTLHLDEKTPHIHAVIVPLTKDGKLSYSEFLGTPEKLRNLQSDYAKDMEEFGLKRGIEGSKARHEDVTEFYKRIKTELNPYTYQEIQETYQISDKSTFESFGSWKDKEAQNIALFMAKKEELIQKLYNENIKLKNNLIMMKTNKQIEINTLNTEKFKIIQQIHTLKKEVSKGMNQNRERGLGL